MLQLCMQSAPCSVTKLAFNSFQEAECSRAKRAVPGDSLAALRQSALGSLQFAKRSIKDKHECAMDTRQQGTVKVLTPGRREDRKAMQGADRHSETVHSKVCRQ